MTHGEDALREPIPELDQEESLTKHNVLQHEFEEDDEVDLASRESFPASDPPAWNAARPRSETPDNDT